MATPCNSIQDNPLSYPKSWLPFSKALFQHPTAEYRGAPLWSWNTALKRNVLLRQIDHLHEMGMGGFHMHVRVGMDTEYLGEEFMGHIRACVEYAKQKDMLACLYDEDRWPSGAAGGLVTKGHPELASQHILLTKVPYGEGETEVPPAFMGFAARSELGSLVARYDVQLDEEGTLRSVERLGDNEEPGSACNLYYAYVEPNKPSPWFNGETYADTLNPAAIKRFIEITHEKYKAALHDDFGKVVPSIFCDEPQFAHKTQLANATETTDIFLPWTLDLPITFQKKYGYDILDSLPEITWNLPNEETSLARYHFHDHVCERFVAAFMDQLSVYCRGNGIALTGHMMEEPFLKTQTASLGEAMRCYRSLDLPGIDLLCDQFEYNTVKQATSVARQNGSKGAMCEIYGVTNWTFTFEGHKGCGDWQMAMGITFRVHHLTWVSMAGEAKRDFPACIGYQSPWYKEYSLIENYFSRVNVVLTRGRPLTRIAVIHPIESYWLCYGPVTSGTGEPEFREECFRDLTHWLAHGLVDFDFVSESLFPEQTDIDGINFPVLKVGACSYEAVLLPNLRTIRSTTLARLQKFAAVGGKVLILGENPSLVDARKTSTLPYIEKSIAVPWTRYAILQSLNPLKDIRILTNAGTESRSLLYQLRTDTDKSGAEERFLFICNTDRTKSVSSKVLIKGAWIVEELDAFTGGERLLQSKISRFGCGESWTEFPYHFDGTASVLLHLLPHSSFSISSRGVGEQQLPISKTFRKFAGQVTLSSVSLSEPNVLLLDYASWKLTSPSKSVSLDWQPISEILSIENVARKSLDLPAKLDNFAQPWTVPLSARVAVAELTLRFRISSEFAIPFAKLALEDAESVVIVLNGTKIPSEVSGWWVDEDIKTVSLPGIPLGESILELTYAFGMMTNIERVYLLGDFGVRICGDKAVMTSPQNESLAFGDWTRQGLPFYAGNVIYECEFEVPPGADGEKETELVVSIPHFVSPVLAISLNGKPAGHIIIEPRMLLLPALSPGVRNKLTITAYGNRENSFGTLHLPDEVTTWFGPNEFRTDRPGWYVREWNVKRMGILAAPTLWKRGRAEVNVQPHILRFNYERAQQRS